MRHYRIYAVGATLVALAAGRPATAQTPATGDVVGQWAVPCDTGQMFEFRRNGSFTLFDVGIFEVNKQLRAVDMIAKWRLLGDTIFFDLRDAYAQAGGMLVPLRDTMTSKLLDDDVVRLVTLKDRVLRMQSLDGHRAYAYARVDSLVPDATTVKPSELIGAWAQQGERDAHFTFRADNMLTVAGTQASPGTGVGTGRWWLRGDTLVVTNFHIAVGEQMVPAPFDRRVIAIAGNQLTMTRVCNAEQGPKSRVYERLVVPAPAGNPVGPAHNDTGSAARGAVRRP